jgi:N-dimethylarginine dimethylaminohydrolase
MSEKKPGADWFLAKALEPVEIIPGMREQGKGIKCYVENDYAPLKAVYVGNPDAFHIPDMDVAWDMANMFAHESDECKAYMRKHAGKFHKEADPERYEKVVQESDALAKADRDAGVKVIRNETGIVPDEIVTFSESWSKQKLVGLYGQAAFEVVGHCLVSLWEVSAEMAVEFQAREVLVEIMKNDPEAVWLSMPFPVPTSWPDPGPRMSAGDIKIFSNKTVLFGIGVEDPSHINDLSKPRSSGNEFAAEILRRMLAPFGWKVETVYFDSNWTYHLDCLLAPFEEGLMAYPKGTLWTPLPKPLDEWEVIDVSREDHNLGCSNNVPLGNKRIIIPEGSTEYAKNLKKRGVDPIEIPYFHCFNIIGSGIHCSSAALWRES